MKNYEIRPNKEYNSNEVYFDGVPGKETREALKALKMRWNPKKGCWYGFATTEEIERACGDVLTIPEAKRTEQGTLYEGWQGGNNNKWTTDEQLKKYILADLKRCGIKATMRFQRGGYTTAFAVTLTIKADMIRTYEDWKKDHRIAWYDWNYYTDEAGKVQAIYGDKLINCKDAELLDNIAKTEYKMELERLTDHATYHAGTLRILTDEGNAILNTAQQIINSYNHDNSNAQIDYFDTSFYHTIYFKAA